MDTFLEKKIPLSTHLHQPIPEVRDELRLQNIGGISSPVPSTPRFWEGTVPSYPPIKSPHMLISFSLSILPAIESPSAECLKSSLNYSKLKTIYYTILMQYRLFILPFTMILLNTVFVVEFIRETKQFFYINCTPSGHFFILHD